MVITIAADNDIENENKNTNDFKKIFNQSNDKINIYTDGSYRNNGKKMLKQVWEYILEKMMRNVSEKIVGLQTNNVGELSAIIR